MDNQPPDEPNNTTGGGRANALADTWFKRGAAEFAQQHYQEAIEFLNQSIDLNDTVAIAWAFRSAAYFGLHNYATALPEAEHALVLIKAAKPVDIRLLTRLLSLYAEILFRLGRYSEALERYTELQSVKALTPLQWTYLADIHRALHQNRKAIAAYHQALTHPERNSSISSTSSASWLKVATFCFNEKAYDDALEASRQAVTVDPASVEGWGIQAQAHFYLKHPLEALAAANRALELDEHYAPGWQVRARAYRALNRTAEARDAYERVRDLLTTDDPHWISSVGEEGRMLLRGGSIKEALRFLKTQAMRKIGKPRP